MYKSHILGIKERLTWPKKVNYSWKLMRNTVGKQSVVAGKEF